MILQRFSQAIVNQKWNTVLLELIVVIVGTFLGLQVDDWNERRKFRQQEQFYLDKLADDLTAMQAELSDKIERNEETIRVMTTALDALESCRISNGAGRKSETETENRLFVRTSGRHKCQPT